MAKLGKQKKVYDDSIRDLDDVYFEVQHREEQRRRQGLPSLIGVLPVNHQPPVSGLEEGQDEPATAGARQGIRSQNTTRSSTGGRRRSKRAPGSRLKRPPGRGIMRHRRTPAAFDRDA
jgi:hypothetical protein